MNVASTLTPIHSPTGPITNHATSPLTWNTGKAFYMFSLLPFLPPLPSSIHSQTSTKSDFSQTQIRSGFLGIKILPWLPIVLSTKSGSSRLPWPWMTPPWTSQTSFKPLFHSLTTLWLWLLLISSTCQPHACPGPLHRLWPLPGTLFPSTNPRAGSFSSLSLGLNDTFSKKLSLTHPF